MMIRQLFQEKYILNGLNVLVVKIIELLLLIILKMYVKMFKILIFQQFKHALFNELIMHKSSCLKNGHTDDLVLIIELLCFLQGKISESLKSNRSILTCLNNEKSYLSRTDRP